MDTTEKLYSPEEIRRLEKKKSRSAAALFIIAGATLAACVCLCLLTHSANARQTETAVYVISAAAGWVCLYIRRFPVKERGREIDHARMLLADGGQEFTGVLTVTKERLRIKNSITIRMVELRENGMEKQLRVIESKVPRLRALEGKAVRVRTVNGYIAEVGAL